jgi:hypothetical protein
MKSAPWRSDSANHKIPNLYYMFQDPSALAGQSGASSADQCGCAERKQWAENCEKRRALGSSTAKIWRHHALRYPH